MRRAPSSRDGRPLTWNDKVAERCSERGECARERKDDSQRLLFRPERGKEPDGSQGRATLIWTRLHSELDMMTTSQEMICCKNAFCICLSN